MLKFTTLAVLFCCSLASRAADLTAQEIRWLRAAASVLAYSQQLQLPLDITVQPQAGASDVALAMGFANGRCKLVVSLRANPDAEHVFAQMPEADHDLLIEIMAAHELGHCWRHVHNTWHAMPAGVIAPEGDHQAQSTRREEAYADLVALAWTRLHHGARYAQVHRWISALRASTPLSGEGHDTRAWLALVRDPERFDGVSQPLADIAPLWRQGLLSMSGSAMLAAHVP